MNAPLLDKDKKQRKPFSGLRCVYDPYFALDADQCEPFSKLSIVVDHAVGLVSKNFNGVSDPYVSLSLNGADPCSRSTTKRHTNKPTWRETFEIDVHHPLSILTIALFEQEFGGGDMVEFLGLEDHLEGWADIRLAALPLNEWVAAWIDLKEGCHYKETITGRLENPPPEKSSCGRIFVKLYLGTRKRQHELFAMCLPLPDMGHSCHLELVDLVHDVVSLSKASEKLDIDWDWILHHATPIFSITMLMTWYPPSILPALTIIYPQILIYVSSKMTEESAPVPVGLGGGTKIQDKKTGEKGETDESKPPAPKRRNTLQRLKAAAQHKDKKGDDVEETLKNLVRIMPKHAAKDLRKSAANVNTLVQLVELVETLSNLRVGFGDRFLIITSLILTIPSAFALWWFQEYQLILVQVVVTCLVAFYLWQYSFPGRMTLGFFYYFLTHWRLRAKTTHSKDADPTSVSIRTLARPHVKHLNLTSSGKLEDEDKEDDPEDLCESDMKSPRRSCWFW